MIQTLLSAAYDDLKDARTAYQSRSALRNTAVLELLFATGVRVSELCSLGEGDVDLVNMTVRVLGKGSKGAGYPDWESSGVADFEEISIRAFSSDLRIGFLFCESG